MGWQRDDIRQVPDSKSINRQQITHRREVPSPQEIPGREVFLERADVPARSHLPLTQSFSTEWVHIRQGFIQPRKNLFRRFLNRFFQST